MGLNRTAHLFDRVSVWYAMLGGCFYYYGIEFSMRSAGMIVLLLMTVFINREIMSELFFPAVASAIFR